MAEIGLILFDVGRIWPNSVGLRAECGWHRPELVNIGQIRTSVRRFGAGCGQNRSNLRAKSVEIRRARAQFGRCRAEIGRDRSHSGPDVESPDAFSASLLADIPKGSRAVAARTCVGSRAPSGRLSSRCGYRSVCGVWCRGESLEVAVGR